MAKGWIYVLSNPSLRALKIGRSSKDPSERAADLSSDSGVPTPFTIEYTALVESCETIEREIHRSLNQCRVNPKREFFDCSLLEAVNTIRKIAGKIFYEEPKSFDSEGPLRSNKSKRRSSVEIWNATPQQAGNYVTKCEICGSDITVHFQYRYPNNHQVICNCIECGWDGTISASRFNRKVTQ